MRLAVFYHENIILLMTASLNSDRAFNNCFISILCNFAIKIRFIKRKVNLTNKFIPPLPKITVLYGIILFINTNDKQGQRDGHT